MAGAIMCALRRTGCFQLTKWVQMITQVCFTNLTLGRSIQALGEDRFRFNALILRNWCVTVMIAALASMCAAVGKHLATMLTIRAANAVSFMDALRCLPSTREG
jgi:hypothetical protein